MRRLNGIYLANLNKSKVHFIEGRAKFSGTNQVSVEEKSGEKSEYTADHILVAVGGYPSWPSNIPGYEHGISSDGFFELEALPKKAVVVGAGYIAVEMAGILKWRAGEGCGPLKEHYRTADSRPAKP